MNIFLRQEIDRMQKILTRGTKQYIGEFRCIQCGKPKVFSLFDPTAPVFCLSPLFPEYSPEAPPTLPLSRSKIRQFSITFSSKSPILLGKPSDVGPVTAYAAEGQRVGVGAGLNPLLERGGGRGEPACSSFSEEGGKGRRVYLPINF